MTRALSSTAHGSVERIEDALGAAPAGLTMRELVAATGLHENALRRTLGRLTARGSVHVEPERRPSRGRPTLRYRRAGPADEPFRRFLPLLLELLGRAPVGDGEAYRIGRAAGNAASPPMGSSLAAIMGLLVELGFEPRISGTSTRGGTDIALARCPFSDVVTSSRHGASICELHRGLLAGVAGARGGELDSFTVRDPRVLPCELSVR